MKAIVVEELGGPEVLRLRERPAPVPQPGQILVDIAVAGVNFMDTGARRAGTGASREVPFVPGVEAAGRVSALGAGFISDEVAAATMMQGLSAQHFAAEAAPVQPAPTRSWCRPVISSPSRYST